MNRHKVRRLRPPLLSSNNATRSSSIEHVCVLQIEKHVEERRQKGMDRDTHACIKLWEGPVYVSMSCGRNWMIHGSRHYLFSVCFTDRDARTFCFTFSSLPWVLTFVLPFIWFLVSFLNYISVLFIFYYLYMPFSTHYCLYILFYVFIYLYFYLFV
jgi:hypothetical protein